MTEPTASPASPPPPSGAPSVPAPAIIPASAAISSAPLLSTPRLVTVNGVNWPNVLDFTHIFRGFRLAINPAKLMIALLAILLIYVAGRLFDSVWGPQVARNEIQQFVSRTSEDYKSWRATQLEARQSNLSRDLRQYTSLEYDQRDKVSADPAQARKALKDAYYKQFDDAQQAALKERQAEESQIKNLSAGTHLSYAAAAETYRARQASASGALLNQMQDLRDTVGHGIFDTFLQYETLQFDRLVENTLTFVRVAPVRSVDVNSSIEGQAVSGALLSRDAASLWRSDTVLGCIANMTITAPRWLFSGAAPMQWRPDNADTWSGWLKMIAYRAGYLLTLIVFAVFSLLILALTGASIARLSALELAGIDRPPLKDVFLFALTRLWTFIKAPVMPFVIVLVIGVVIALLAMVGAIPWLGPIIIGVLFFLTLAVCFVLMLLLLGVLGGFNLLYPTIAVEGADSFDAMSRSFAYVYSRPWRLLFYTVTALIYGVITFLFVSFAVYLILLLAHTFVGWGMGLFGAHYGTYSGAPALDTLWPAPQFLRLVQPINWYAMSWAEFTGALFLHFWLFLLITGIGAYVISYYFSSHTIIYLLLRRSVDGQNLRDVYMEEAGSKK